MNLPADMVGQFLLGKTEVPALASWSKQQIGRWILHWHPRLPITQIRSQDGRARFFRRSGNLASIAMKPMRQADSSPHCMG